MSLPIILGAVSADCVIIAHSSADREHRLVDNVYNNLSVPPKILYTIDIGLYNDI